MSVTEDEEPDLHRAATDGSADALTAALDRGDEILATDHGGMTALHRASVEGHQDCARLLLDAAHKAGCLQKIANAKNVDGFTALDVAADEGCFRLLRQYGCCGDEALYKAAEWGLVDVLRELLDSGADISTTDHLGMTSLHRASRGGSEECVQILLDAAQKCGCLKQIVNAKNVDGLTALDVAGYERSFRLLRQNGCCGGEVLHKAAEWGLVEILRELLDSGADIAITDHLGMTALHRASRGGSEESVRVLLDAAKSEGRLEDVINLLDKDGRTPLDVFENMRSFSLLRQHGGRGREALHKAAKWGLTDDVQELLNSGADVAATDSEGRNALHWASEWGRQECLQVLLDAARSGGVLEDVINADDNDEKTPLDLSLDPACFYLLLQHGGRGRSALHKATKWGLTDAVTEVLGAGADVATTDADGWTALHWATHVESEECLRVLLEAAQRMGCLEAVVSAEDNKGRTPADISWNATCFSLLRLHGGRGREAIHKAAQLGLADALRDLLGAGADVTATDVFGKTALHRASYKGREECVRVLLDAADSEGSLDSVVNAVDKEGLTSLDVCQNARCFSMLRHYGGRGREELRKAAQWGLADALKDLLTSGADVAAPDPLGMTALHLASLRGKEECVRVLLDAAQTQGRLQAVVNAADNRGRTPLDVSWNESCSSLLRQHGGRDRTDLQA